MNHDERAKMTDNNWNEMLGRASVEWRIKLRHIEKSAYESTHDNLPETKRNELARHIVLLGMLSDLNAEHRPTYIRRFIGQGWQGVVRGLEHRATVYGGAASSIEKRWIPENATSAHRCLVRALRDLAAIDRRAATELKIRTRKNLEHYSTGEDETRNAFQSINKSVFDIILAMRCFFKKGSLDRLIFERDNEMKYPRN